MKQKNNNHSPISPRFRPRNITRKTIRYPTNYNPSLPTTPPQPSLTLLFRWLPKPSQALSLFIIPFDQTKPGLDLCKIKRTDPVPSTPTKSSSIRIVSLTSSLIGAEGSGFEMVLHGMNAERCLLAGEALGLGYAALSALRIMRERGIW